MKIVVDRNFCGEDSVLYCTDDLRYRLYKNQALSMVNEMVRELVLRAGEKKEIFNKIRKLSFVVEVEE